MKMKILVVPLTITIAVIFLVWLIYPAYSNGVDGIKENYAQLKSEQKKLDELRNKNKNIVNLSNQITALPQKDVLYSFITEDAKEEEILNSLGRLAAESGLLLFDATVNQPAKTSENVISLDLEAPGALDEPAELQVKNLETEMKLAGSYEAIRNFLGKLGTFSRSNEIDTMEIRRNVSKSGTVSDSGALIVSASANFNFLSKVKLNESSVSNDVFASPRLEGKIIEDIKAERSSQIFQLTVGQKGRANLFQ